jgi:hypothetical protein
MKSPSVGDGSFKAAVPHSLPSVFSLNHRVRTIAFFQSLYTERQILPRLPQSHAAHQAAVRVRDRDHAAVLVAVATIHSSIWK